MGVKLGVFSNPEVDTRRNGKVVMVIDWVFEIRAAVRIYTALRTRTAKADGELCECCSSPILNCV